MSESATPDDSGVVTLLTSTDGVPKFCVVCGAPATGQSSRPIPAPEELPTGLMVELFSMTIGRLFFWSKKPFGSPGRSRPRAAKNWIQLPHCSQHGTSDIQEAIGIVNVDGRTLEIRGASSEYRQGVEVLQAPPSAEFWSSLDTEPKGDADEFLKELDKKGGQSPGDFLKGLERDDDDDKGA